ncbi:fimbrial protein [Providencia vermicola]|uniref:fimbrial protein n=1 Tax=Providencia vermicola TaxID=333965 RepID=UPI00220F12D7|nr:type 1 fimbrial protein [Providencia stuartii]
MTKYSILLFSLLFLTGNSSFANSLTVYFEGVLVPLGCRLSDDDAQKKIYLSGLRFSSLETLGRSEVQPFQLDIVDCSAMALNKTIKITLNTQNTEMHNGINYLKTTGESNVLLALTDSNGKELDLNTKIDVSTVTESGKGSINTLSFGVYAQKPFNARLQTGSFASTVTFSLDYQ